MERLNLLMIVPGGDFPRRLNCLLRFQCEFFKAEHMRSPSFSKTWGRLPARPMISLRAPRFTIPAGSKSPTRQSQRYGDGA